MALTVVERAMVVAYRNGLKEAITDYAVWNNGGQYVGVMRKPLREVLAEVDARTDEDCLRSALRAT